MLLHFIIHYNHKTFLSTLQSITVKTEELEELALVGHCSRFFSFKRQDNQSEMQRSRTQDVLSHAKPYLHHGKLGAT